MLFLVGCTRKGTPSPVDSPAPPETPTVSAPSITPSPSPIPVPLAGLANGWPITLAEYQSELALYLAAQASNGTNLAADAVQQVLNDLIAQALLAQAAQQSGFVVDDAALQTRIDQLTAQLGSPQALADWLNSHNYTDESFRLALRRSTAAAWMRDQIINAVPNVAEQIHARQILLYNSDDANSVLSQLKNGADFATLAFQYDPAAGGDLGWFPRGYLVSAAVEDGAFSLQPNQFSDVIASSLGYHIVQVIERDPQRPVEAPTRLILQEQALTRWVTEQRNQGAIEILISP